MVSRKDVLIFRVYTVLKAQVNCVDLSEHPCSLISVFVGHHHNSGKF